MIRRRVAAGLAVGLATVGLAATGAADLGAAAAADRSTAVAADRSTAVAAGCGDALPKPSRLLAQADGWQLAFAPQPWPVPVGRHFSLDIVVCPPPGWPVPAALRVDAEMPAHRHGMNYRATTQSLGGGRFRADGLMFHMPGRWRFMFDLEAAAATPVVRLTQDLDLK